MLLPLWIICIVFIQGWFIFPSNVYLSIGLAKESAVIQLHVRTCSSFGHFVPFCEGLRTFYMYSYVLASVVNLCWKTYSILGYYCGPVERGACVIQCSPGEGLYEDLGLAACPPNHMCRSTGCGTMCYQITTETSIGVELWFCSQPRV